MKNERIRALILDFDGVILDSNALKTDAFREVFARFPDHADAMMAYHQQHISQSRYDKFAYLVEQRLGRERDREFVERLASDYASALRDGMEACPFVPGARELLEELSPKIPLYLASVTPEAELLRLLDVRGIRHHFTRIYGCPPWTKPAAVAAIIAELGRSHGLALVGDSAGDQHAATVNGIEFIPRESGLLFDPPVEGLRDMHAVAVHLRPRLSV